MTFDERWEALQATLYADTEIPNWTAANGYFGDPFRIVLVTPSYIEVDPRRAENIQHIPKGEFRKVHERWEGYLRGTFPRKELRDLTRFSKYIISIFHWLGEQR
ncbi:MAG: hypothetical protein HYY96_02925 [Candidatus Tectomicrobia bacterium]|nr:hypothetical protein [Candidatus Tectomicrobia bacterium]